LKAWPQRIGHVTGTSSGRWRRLQALCCSLFRMSGPVAPRSGRTKGQPSGSSSSIKENKRRPISDGRTISL